MANIFSFCKTVRGHSHVTHDRPCDDHSLAFYDETADCTIAAVSDGHGSPAYARSRFGSEFAVRSAAEAMQQFAAAQTVPTPEALRTLTDDILARWHEKVQAHLAEHPLTPEETANMPEKTAAAYLRGEHLPSLYGTTLIAALWMQDKLLLVQQGDGRCAVFYPDGNTNQPIPWDPGCYDNITTSMCDTNARERIRTHVIDLHEKPVAAVFLGTDGVEDSFTSMQGLHVFYMQLSRIITEQPDTLDARLTELLPRLSKSGSHDDVSVAGLADCEALRKLIPYFLRIIKNRMMQQKAPENKVQKKLAMLRPLHERQKMDILHTEVNLLDMIARKSGTKSPLTREVITKYLFSNDPHLVEAADDVIEARTCFTECHQKLRELEAQLAAQEQS